MDILITVFQGVAIVGAIVLVGVIVFKAVAAMFGKE